MTLPALVAAALIATQPGPVHAFDVRAGPADRSINNLAAQAGVDITITARLGGLRTPAVRGHMPVETAFARVLAPVGARAVRIREGVYRIETISPRAARPPRPVRPAPAPEPRPVDLGDIVVTASPPIGPAGTGGRTVIDAGALDRAEGLGTSEAIADLSATVDSTRQGTGRNKLFVRGLADSAMNGPLQATVGQYLGDLRLNSGSPDPDLALVDIRGVEVFEGPQGTRFGAGSIGGVLRILPEKPALDASSARLTTGTGGTAGGDVSGDAAVVLNTPLGGRAAARLVAYERREGGFIDNPGLGLREKDDVQTTGARAALRWVGDTWAIDMSALAQRVRGGDAQTVPADRVRLQKTGVLEPYESTITLAGLTVHGRVGAADVTWAMGISSQGLQERFDATASESLTPAVVDRDQRTRTASTELRVLIEGPGAWSWSGGAALAAGETVVERRRRVLAPDTPILGADLTRTFTEATLFGEAVLVPSRAWRVAAGGRLSAVRIDSDILTVDPASTRIADDRDNIRVRFTPTVSTQWQVSATTTVFGRLERAVRPAGVGESGGAFERYDGDQVTLVEMGARSHAWRADLSGEISVGWLDWRDVQADIVLPGGDLVTDNVGDGVIRFASLKAAWRASPYLDISGGLFVNHSRLTPNRPSVIGGGTTQIPNVAPVGAQFSLDWRPGSIAGAPLRLGADMRYVGQSQLGVGAGLDVPQGGYLRTELTARLGGERRAITVRISNPLDSDGTRYGIGSPYQLTEPQVIPVRPLTIRLGFETSF